MGPLRMVLGMLTYIEWFVAYEKFGVFGRCVFIVQPGLFMCLIAIIQLRILISLSVIVNLRFIIYERARSVKGSLDLIGRCWVR